MKKVSDLEFMVDKERADSECCSGCQSGWTLYLDQSQSQERLTRSFQLRTDDCDCSEEEEEEEEEEEDLSMLSDASSGPPHVHEEEDNISSGCCEDGNGCLCNATFLPLTTVARNRIKRRRAEEEQQGKRDSFLDDTASSTLSTFSKATTTSSCGRKKLLMEDDHSCCFSTTHFTGKTALPKHLAYLHSSAGMQTRR
ncbi:hypothetical protein KFK09_009144 [Dendrobium nobile]|uniref:Uncharacterized protein n=1 Tax=Dendrobium nobile TaxID=94219 RepID=A0A8T3BPL6_DENNO|nr:hypothetical protein KFK09_009144 [Dendrobium nobile]